MVNKIETAVKMNPSNIPQTSNTVLTKSIPSSGIILICFPKTSFILIPPIIPNIIGNNVIMIRSNIFAFVFSLRFN